MANTLFTGDPVPKGNTKTPAPAPTPKDPTPSPMTLLREKKAELKIPDLSELSIAIKNAASEDEYLPPTLGTAPGIVPGNDYFRKNIKKKELKDIETRVTKKFEPMFQEWSDNLFGKDGSKVERFMTQTPAGNYEPDMKKIEAEVEKLNTQYKGDGNTKTLISARFKQAALEKQLLREAEALQLKNGMKLSESKAKDDIQKQIEALTTKAKLAAKQNAQIVKDKYGLEIEQAKNEFLTNQKEITEIYQMYGEDLPDQFDAMIKDQMANAKADFENIQWGMVERGELNQEEAMRNIEAQEKDMNDYLNPKNEKLRKDKEAWVANTFKEKFEQSMSEELAPHLEKYLATVREKNKQAKRELELLNSKTQKEIEAGVANINAKDLALRNSQVANFKSAIDQVVKSREEKEKWYRASLKATGADILNRGMMPLAETFTGTFKSNIGMTMRNLGTFLRSVDLDGSISDWLSGNGANMEVENRLFSEDLTLDNALSLDMIGQVTGQVLGQQVPQFGAMAVTALLTRNPVLTAQVAGAFGVVNNIVQMREDTVNMTLENGGSMSEAIDNGRKMVAAELAMAPLEMFEASTLVKTFIGKGAVSKIVNTVFGGITEFAQEKTENAAQKAIVNKDVNFAKSLFSMDDFQAAAQAGFGNVVLGAGSSVMGSARSKANVQSAANQVVADMIQRKGKDYANMMIEYEFNQGNIDEDELMQGKEKVEQIAAQVQDAAAAGLNKEQTQLYVGISGEIKELEAKAASVSDQNIKDALEKNISEKKKELEGVLNGTTVAANVVLPSGGTITTTTENAAAILDSEEGKMLVENGVIDIVSEDEKLSQKKEALKAEDKVVEVEKPIEVNTELIGVLDANKDNFKGPLGMVVREALSNPDEQAGIVKMIEDQVADDPAIAESVYGKEVVDAFSKKEDVEAANDTVIPEEVTQQPQIEESKTTNNENENKGQEAEVLTAPEVEMKREVKAAMKPDINLPFITKPEALDMKFGGKETVVSQSGRSTQRSITIKSEQAKIKKEFQGVKQLIDCIWR